MYLHKHILVGANVDYHWSKKNKEPLVDHDNIVIHYTAGGTALSTVNFLVNDRTPASAHLVIGRDGRIYQLVDFTTQAWHAGSSRFLGKPNQNKYSIGIELENAGLLKQRGTCYFTWFGKKVPEYQVVKLVNPQTGSLSCWHTYTDYQLNALREVIGLLLLHYKFKHIVGHSEISLSGKIDPGPAFPMDEFKSLIKH